jgi:hypothetical protein
VDDDDVTLLGVFYTPSAAAPVPPGGGVSGGGVIGGGVSAELSRIDWELIDLLAESLARKIEPVPMRLAELSLPASRRVRFGWR